MKSEYTNEEVVRGSALSNVISLNDKKNGHNGSSCDDVSIKRKEYEHDASKSVEDKSPFYKLETRHVYDWPDLDEIALPDERCEDLGNSKNINSDEPENTPLNNSCNIEVKVEINSIRTSIDEYIPGTNIDDNQFLCQAEPDVTVNQLSIDDKMSVDKSNISEKKQNDVTFHDIHNSKSENNSLKSDGERFVKPILLSPPPLLSHHRRKSAGSNIEQKSVTFSEDTVFNDNKSKRYKKEKMNLKDIYSEEKDNDTAIAKVNPMFFDDEEDSKDLNKDDNLRIDIHGKQLTDEKVTTFSIENADRRKRVDLNMTYYMQKYLSRDNEDEDPYPNLSTFVTAQLPQENKQQTEIATPPFGRLIERTLRKERQKKVVRLLILTVTLIVILSIAIGIGVYFGLR